MWNPRISSPPPFIRARKALACRPVSGSFAFCQQDSSSHYTLDAISGNAHNSQDFSSCPWASAVNVKLQPSFTVPVVEPFGQNVCDHVFQVTLVELLG